MAGLEAVAAGSVSAVVGAVVKKAGSYGLEFLGARSELRNAIDELETRLSSIKELLARTKQEPSWLSNLKDAVYEAEAVLDEIEYERLKRQILMCRKCDL